MTRPTTPFDRALEQFKKDMRWSPQSTESEKSLVLGNLNGFTALLNKMLLETSDAEILAAVAPADLAEGHRIKDAALLLAADWIKDLDGGDMAAETGWKSQDSLDVWLKVRAAIDTVGDPSHASTTQTVA